MRNHVRMLLLPLLAGCSGEIISNGGDETETRHHVYHGDLALPPTNADLATPPPDLAMPSSADLATSPTTDQLTPWVYLLSGLYGTKSVTGTIPLEALATDDVGVTHVDFFRVDGAGNVLASLGSATTAPYRVSFDTTTIGNGTALFQARAFDAAGHRGDSNLGGFNVVNGQSTSACDSNNTIAAPAQVTSVTPVSGAKANVVSSPSAGLMFFMLLEPAIARGQTVNIQCATENFGNLDIAALAPNTHYQLVALTSDACGNLAASQAVDFTTGPLVAETTPPTESAFSIIGLAQNGGIASALRLFVDDQSGIRHVDLFANGSSTPLYSEDTATVPYAYDGLLGRWSAGVIPSSLLGTQVTFTAKSTDVFGNVAEESQVVSTPAPGDLDCGNPSSWPVTPANWPAAWVTLEQQIFGLVNQVRQSGATCAGTQFPPAAPLTQNAQLTQSARCHSLDMALHNYFNHNGLDGDTPLQRITAAGYSASLIEENIAAGRTIAQDVMNDWMSDYGHCANIMNATLTNIGVGWAFESSSQFGTYQTQDFGKP